MSQPTIRPLSWSENYLLHPLLDAYSSHFPSTGAFDAWREGLAVSVMTEQIKAISVWERDALRGGIFHSGTDGMATLMGEFGQIDETTRLAALAELKKHHSAIIFSEESLCPWSERLEGIGFSFYVRQTLVADLRRVIFQPEPEDDLIIQTWDARYTDEVVHLLASANAGTLDGLFMTVTRPPNPEACEACLKSLLSGEEGQFLPWASFLALDETGVCGLILCTETEDGNGLLYELAVHPRAQGRKLSRRILQASERAFLNADKPFLRFMTMAENTPVQRLFHSDWLVSFEESRGGYWLRGD